MTIDEAEKIIDNAERDYTCDALYKALVILHEYSDKRINFQFEHDQCWIGAMDFEEYVEVMSEDDIRRMAVLGWFGDEKSWSHFS